MRPTPPQRTARSTRPSRRLAALAACAAVAAHAPAQLTERPIRGAWLRPPGSLTLLDNILADLAPAGITDLYLETFWWGRTTNLSTVFTGNHFGVDYLAQAIPLAARRGIRVHAWLESAYWSYQGTGDYLLNAHPEWKVVDFQGNTNLGDQADQVFVNLAHPGVQDMLARYCTELATNYPGLWGIQTDYHRFPLDNNTADSQTAPFSYDAWSVQAFQQLYPVNLSQFDRPNDAFFDEFTEFRREGIAQAARVMHEAIRATDPGVQFSGAVFARALTDSSQLVKMQDWPRMARNGWLPVVVPMAYGTSTASIRTDLQAANQQRGPSRIVAGLAILTNQTRPTIAQQLATAAAEGITSFIFFDANVISANEAREAELADYLDDHAPTQTADLNQDRRVDGLDWTLFFDAFAAAPSPVSPLLAPFDITRDGQLNQADRDAFLHQFRAFRFGDDGHADAKDLQALRAAFTPFGQTFPLHLYDLDADGDVDCFDEVRLRTLLTKRLPVTLNPDLTGDGLADIFDVLAYFNLFGAADPLADIDGNGSLNIFDILGFFSVFVASCA